MKNILKVVFVIIGTLIGAGFASGQEINTFFFSYGIKGIIGIIVSYTLMGIIIYKTLIIVKENKITNYIEFLDIIIKTKRKKTIIENIINIIINIFILITFFIMVAGFGAYTEQELGIKSEIGSIILAILIFMIFMTNIKGVIKANEILIPILIAFLIIIGILNIRQIDILNIKDYIIQKNQTNWILSAILYCSYNSILLIPSLITLKNYINTKKEITKISIITSAITILLALIIYIILIRVDVDIKNLEMPIVYVINNSFRTIKKGYGFIILTSIFTTAISLGNSFLQNFCKNEKKYTQTALIMCITSVIISKFGFSNLVNLLYPIFGYLGIIQIFYTFNTSLIRKNN